MLINIFFEGLGFEFRAENANFFIYELIVLKFELKSYESSLTKFLDLDTTYLTGWNARGLSPDPKDSYFYIYFPIELKFKLQSDVSFLRNLWSKIIDKLRVTGLNPQP